MNSNPREKGKFQANKDGETINYGKLSKASTSSRQWLSLRNPRIVRVSRGLGGKDRHSKVWTIRGLRDRRIRLSVPTAIQLYDLQERLGLGQPSKVIDWLLELTKLDIDKLPPLQIPHGFGQFPQQSSAVPPFFSANSNSEFIKNGLENDDPATEKGKGKWVRGNDHLYHQMDMIGAHNFLPGNSFSENTSALFPPEMEDHHPNDATFFAPSGSQLFFCPPLMTSTLFTTQASSFPKQWKP